MEKGDLHSPWRWRGIHEFSRDFSKILDSRKPVQTAVSHTKNGPRILTNSQGWPSDSEWPSACPLTPKGPFRTKNTTTIAKIVNYYAVVFLLRPPNLLRREPFFERKNVCNSQENGVRTRRAAIVNHPAVLKILRVVNLLCVVLLVRRGPLGRSLYTSFRVEFDLDPNRLSSWR